MSDGLEPVLEAVKCKHHHGHTNSLPCLIAVETAARLYGLRERLAEVVAAGEVYVQLGASMDCKCWRHLRLAELRQAIAAER
jgi:hypothetical protein